MEELDEIKNFKLKDLPSINAKTLDYLNLYKVVNKKRKKA
jgi:hypothetical protein